MENDDGTGADGQETIRDVKDFRLPDKARTELDGKFAWVAVALTKLLPNFDKWGNPDHMVAYLAALYEDGAIETNEDAVAAVEIYAARMGALQFLDVANTQLATFRKLNPTLETKGAFQLKSLAESAHKLLKVSMEMRDAQAITRRVRKELGMQGGGGLRKLTQDVAGVNINDAEDMVGFLKARMQERTGDAGTLFEGSSVKLTMEQMRTLVTRPDEAPK